MNSASCTISFIKSLHFFLLFWLLWEEWRGIRAREWSAGQTSAISPAK